MAGVLPALALCAAILAAPARAVEPDEILSDSRLEARARALSAELRCLVCQNQSIDDSSAPLARDLRLIVRERLAAGASDDDVRRFVVERYGAFVLLRPPLTAGTMLLWLAPLLILLAVATSIWRRMAAPAPAPAAAEVLSRAEQERLAELLGPEREGAGDRG
jgi:cytochrome c-type biogenesis protein CcmH